METFLGVPIMVGGHAWGNLYLCDKLDGEPFTDADEQAVVVLAEWAAVAVENARQFERSQQRRRELEATMEIARALGGETDLARILELIVRRGLGLLGADGLLILLRERDGLTVAAGAGDVPAKFDGARLRCGPDRVRDALGLAARDGTVVPLVFRGRTLGMLVALGGHHQSEDDTLLHSFAANAATAVATARSVEEQRLRDAMHAAEEERRRWARELHDTTLQGLGGVRMMLTAGSRTSDPDRLREILRQAMARLEEEIAGLRGLVRELRPAALDELGLAAAIEGLATRAAEDSSVEVVADVSLLRPRHDPDVETAVYRIVQEAVTNATRHAGARHVLISVTEDVEALQVRVADDGRGFDPRAATEGFGLAGMRERVTLLHGELEVASSEEGTVISAAIPNQYFPVTGGAVLPMAGAPSLRTVEP
jgi:signal transduction histidine kinase